MKLRAPLRAATRVEGPVEAARARVFSCPGPVARAFCLDLGVYLTMVTVPTLRTERLVLRPWRQDDLAPFATLNADPDVACWIGDGAPLARADSDALVERITEHWRERGFGLWAVEEQAGGAFVGFAGLAVPWFLPAVLPAVEVGWRLARGSWGNGYATEAGAAALAHGFQELGLAEVIATIFPENLRSIRVAQKLGLTYTGTRSLPATRRPIAIYRRTA
ncbi:MAG: GNAT family N-acetyltransferase [Solirubrobacterales bacterium]|nr:GNAT family N-acetyltransferase [Solirubrobacterales bacterium]